MLTSLWNKVITQTQHAFTCGALQSIPTEYELIEQDGIIFLVRIVSNLARKDKAKKQEKNKTLPFNPFLPYDKDLFVTNISDTHLCLLNKFNVVDYHLLIVTREFEDQENWLTLQDFEALWICLEQIDGLAFYNGGEAAGASQPHKHLQLIPFPFSPEISQSPIETVVNLAILEDNLIGTIPSFPLVHAFAKFNPQNKTAKISLEIYQQLLKRVGLWQGEKLGKKQTGAYNLLVTRDWMLLVPRSQESFQSISVNSLGFAGALLVQNAEQLDLLKQYTPMTILKNVAIQNG